MYEFSKNNIIYKSIFNESKIVPDDLPITAVLSVPILNKKIVMVKHTNSVWDIPGGHLEVGESWQEAINRELFEEAGIIVDYQQIIGYFKITTENSQNFENKYPSPSAILVTLSFVQKKKIGWRMNNEIEDRDLVSFNNLENLLKERKDNNQLLNVLNISKKILDTKDFSYQFSFIDDIEKNKNIFTQVYGFCRDLEKNLFCLVRDTGENHYSLPGGGCEINEFPKDAFIRELKEEAQLIASNIQFIGSTKVEVWENKKLLQTFLQARYYCEIQNIDEFIPNKDNFETEERIFVNFDELTQKISWLKTDSGVKCLKKIEEIIKK